MSHTWHSDEQPTIAPITPIGWLRAVLRGSVLFIVTLLSLGLLLLLRLVERPFWGQHRPFTPYITQFVCRFALIILGIRTLICGDLMHQKGAVVANHSTWLDIFVLNARKRIYFVSKSEVADWPGVGLLARATGTVFIRREKRDAKRQKNLFQSRLEAGHKLLFFPEGTSTDGTCILPFKSTLFEAFFAPELLPVLWIQPVTVEYRSPPGQAPGYYGWWGDMELAPHLLKILAAPRQGTVQITYHPPLKVSDYENRKTLAMASEASVRAGLDLA